MINNNVTLRQRILLLTLLYFKNYYLHAYKPQSTLEINYYERATNEISLTNTSLCETLEISTVGESCAYSIWNETGNLLFSTFNASQNFPSCVDQNHCYSIAPLTLQGDCTYTIDLAGEIVENEVPYNPKFTETLFRVGNCPVDVCGKDSELLITNDIDDIGSLNYTQLVVNRKAVNKGAVAAGNYESICLDLNDCNIFESDIQSSASFFLIRNDTVTGGELNSFEAFGTCESNCSDLTLLLMTNTIDFEFSLAIDGVFIEKKSLDATDNTAVCLDSTQCTIISGSTNATYLIFKEGKIIDAEKEFQFGAFGTCTCDRMPVLSSTSRGKEIILLLSTISGMEALADFNSPQYQAACWLINYDPLNLSEADSNILQRYVLSLIYFTTGGPNWNFNLGFLTSKNECEWEAIKCNIAGFVTQIALDKNNLAGSLVSEFQTLSYLEHMDFNFNSLSGTLPSGLGMLNLKHIDFSDNDLNGPFPPSIFNIETLQTLRVSRNSFTGTLPLSIQATSNMSTFIAESNLFTGVIPSWIGDAKFLAYLSLSHNFFTGEIPHSLGNLTNLVTLFLDSNKLSSSIPGQIFSLTNLSDVDLSFNKITGFIPTEIVTNVRLRSLRAENNLLNGTLPFLSTSSNISTLVLSSNQLSGSFPSSFEYQHTLDYLKLEYNQITGKIPYTQCDQFAYLSADCDIPKKVSCECCSRCFGLFTPVSNNAQCATSEIKIMINSSVSDFIDFSLEDDSNEIILEDSLKTKIDNYTYSVCVSSTGCFRLRSNSAVGTGQITLNVSVDDVIIFENLTATSDVTFGYSRAGSFSPNTCDNYDICDSNIVAGTDLRARLNEITRFTNMTILEDNNSFQHKSLCWWLSDLDRLTEESLKNTALIQRYLLSLFFYSTKGVEWKERSRWLTSESECRWFGVSCSIGIVNRLDLSRNNLRGTIPTEIGEIKGLEYLMLKSNNIVGYLPSQLSKLRTLKGIFLEKNFLGGSIPTEIHLIEELVTIDFRSNKFTGSLPTTIGLLSKLKELKISENSFSGDVKDKLANLTELKTLNVSNNLFQGSINLGYFSKLEIVDLGLNYFSGQLPLDRNNVNLRIARLNSNLFSGSIPSFIGRLYSLEELYLFNNQIRGSLPIEIGSLHAMVKMSLSYNQIKGTIPPEIGNLERLDLLQLQSNQLEGNADYFSYHIDSYVTDCGNTETSESLISCDQCSQCCNANGDCITPSETWPRYVILGVTSSTPTAIMLLSFGWLFMLVLAVILTIFKQRLPKIAFRFDRYFQSYSVYRFLLTANLLGWCIALLCALFHVWVTFTFFRAGDSSLAINDYVYSISCPNDGVTCEDKNQTTLGGWLTFGIIIVIFTLCDMLEGFFIYYNSCVSRKTSVSGIFAGLIMLSAPVVTIVASCFFLNAISVTDAELLQEAVAIMFLSDIDEQLWSILHRVNPNWVETLDTEVIDRYYFEHMTRNLSLLRSSNISMIMKKNREGYDENDGNEVPVILSAEDVFPVNSESSESSREEGGTENHVTFNGVKENSSKKVEEESNRNIFSTVASILNVKKLLIGSGVSSRLLNNNSGQDGLKDVESENELKGNGSDNESARDILTPATSPSTKGFFPNDWGLLKTVVLFQPKYNSDEHSIVEKYDTPARVDTRETKEDSTPSNDLNSFEVLTSIKKLDRELIEIKARHETDRKTLLQELNVMKTDNNQMRIEIDQIMQKLKHFEIAD